MDLVFGLPRSPCGHDAIWVIVDKLTKSTHFLTICLIDSTDVLSRLYVRKIVHLHGILVTIISNRDA